LYVQYVYASTCSAYLLPLFSGQVGWPALARAFSWVKTRAEDSRHRRSPSPHGFKEAQVSIDRRACKVGEATMMQASFGLQFGGQVYAEIVFLESEKDFQNFTSGNIWC
jgi:hypothetical protein